MSQEITVTLKTLDGKRCDVTVNPQDTIESKVESFKNLIGYTEFNVKMIHSGRILDRQKTFADSNLKTGEVIVVMKLRDQPQPQPQPVQTTSTQPVQTVQPTPAPMSVPVVPAQVQSAQSTVRAPIPGRIIFPITDPGRIIFPITDRPQIRRASAVGGVATNPNAQSPHPPQSQSHQSQPQPPRTILMTTQQYWAQPAPLEECSPRFSVEQVHAMIPLLMSYITENPQLCTLLLRSQEAFRSVVTGPGFRGIVRQMLEQSPLIVNALRTGVQASMTINSSPNTVPYQQQNEQHTDTNNDSDEDSSSHGDESNTIPALTELLSAVVNATGQTAESNIVSEPVSEPNEQEDIAQLVSLTGVPAPLAKQVYDSCGRNVGVAAELLFQVLNGEN